MEFIGIANQLSKLLEGMLNTANYVEADFASPREIDIMIDKINQKLLHTTDPYDVRDLEEDIATLKKWRKKLVKEEV